MSSEATASSSPVITIPGFRTDAHADRAGVIASTLCAIHCAATPILLLLLPTVGKFWSHPASHWGMALFVVPLAILMMKKGYRRHGRIWIIALGTLGILFVLAGAAAPHVEGALAAAAQPESSSALLHGAGAHQCSDACCPSIAVMEDGSRQLEIPTASVLTTAGGFFLIITHMGNLCRRSSCGHKG